MNIDKEKLSQKIASLEGQKNTGKNPSNLHRQIFNKQRITILKDVLDCLEPPQPIAEEGEVIEEKDYLAAGFGKPSTPTKTECEYCHSKGNCHCSVMNYKPNECCENCVGLVLGCTKDNCECHKPTEDIGKHLANCPCYEHDKKRLDAEVAILAHEDRKPTPTKTECEPSVAEKLVHRDVEALNENSRQLKELHDKLTPPAEEELVRVERPDGLDYIIVVVRNSEKLWLTKSEIHQLQQKLAAMFFNELPYSVSEWKRIGQERGYWEYFEEPLAKAVAALEWIAIVNATDYEYQNKARKALADIAALREEN